MNKLKGLIPLLLASDGDAAVEQLCKESEVEHRQTDNDASSILFIKLIIFFL